jgi:hypothetical protein
MGRASVFLGVVVLALVGCPSPKKPAPGANRAPEPVDDVAMTAVATAVTVDVRANDRDPDGDSLTVALVSTPAHGTAVVNDNGTVTYTPAGTWEGREVLTYTVEDGRGLSAQANLAVTVQGDCADRDRDSHHGGRRCPGGTDCDDNNPTVHPGAVDTCGNWRDDNCDGHVDESCACGNGTTRLCSRRVDPATLTADMACRPGLERCLNGEWEGTCVGEVLPAPELCNQVDDNCDGRVDEGLRNAVGQCLADHPAPPPEDCGPTGEGNGVDDNGDGRVDESCDCNLADPALLRRNQPCYTGPVQTLGVGVCHAGTRSCQAGGAWTACQGEVKPSAEVCGNLLDDDCDGLVDETCPSGCVNPVPETCDGRDNDCDGEVDEGVRNPCGGCAPLAHEDTCGDGLDNDCNGLVDEDCGCVSALERCYPGPFESAGVGTCDWGERSCSAESVGECVGAVLPAVELCGEDGSGNGLDEDCDGVPDNGCGCPEGMTRPCGSAAGACAYGTQTCTAHRWGDCAGGVTPQPETCDGVDNDCDGVVDDGLINACGLCDQPCYLHPVDPRSQGQRDDSVIAVAAGDAANPSGRAGITLSQRSFIPPYAWAANHENNTVTKFNTDTETEEGIFWVGANPSRTAVDLDGNVWVGGRDDGRVTKILWDVDSCPDRNNNGVKETSRNVGGVVERVNSDLDPLADECVVFSEVVNPARPSVRGLAASPDGRMWVGYTNGGVQAIDARTLVVGAFYAGEAVQRFTPDAQGVQQPVPGHLVRAGGVYGLVVDSRGQLFAARVDARNTLAQFDTLTEQWVAVYQGLCGSYGIAVDGRDRIWLGTHPHCRGVNMFDQQEKRFYTLGVGTETPSPGAAAPAVLLAGNVYDQVVNNGGWPGGAVFDTTGVAVEPATGDVWASFYMVGYTGRLRLDEADLSRSTWTLIGTTRQQDNSLLPGVGTDMRGIGFDHLGSAWTLGLNSDRIFKIDPATNERSATMPLGKSIGIGSHYTYSDFTGSTALSFTAPRGFWRYVFTTPFGQAKADTLALEATVTQGTTVGSRVRALDDVGAPGPWVPADTTGVATFLPYPEGQARHVEDLTTRGPPLVGRAFEVELRLTTTDRDRRPVVHDVKIGWERP